MADKVETVATHRSRRQHRPGVPTGYIDTRQTYRKLTVCFFLSAISLFSSHLLPTQSEAEAMSISDSSHTPIKEIDAVSDPLLRNGVVPLTDRRARSTLDSRSDLRAG